MLLTLSSAGVALHVTVLSTIGLAGRWAVGMASLATVAFVLSILAALLAMKMSVPHLEEVLRGGDGKSWVLSALDLVSLGAFLIGVLLTILQAIPGIADAWGINLPLQ